MDNRLKKIIDVYRDVIHELGNEFSSKLIRYNSDDLEEDITDDISLLESSLDKLIDAREDLQIILDGEWLEGEEDEQ